MQLVHRVCLKASNVMCGVRWLFVTFERKPQRAAHQSNYMERAFPPVMSSKKRMGGMAHSSLAVDRAQ